MEILLVLQIVLVVAMIGVILVQKSGSDGFTGGASPNSFMTGRSSANLFTRITAILATLFIANSLVLAYLASHTERASSVLEKAIEESEKENAGKPKADKGSLGDLEKKLDFQSPENKSQENKPADATKTETPKTEDRSVPLEKAPASPSSVPAAE